MCRIICDPPHERQISQFGLNELSKKKLAETCPFFAIQRMTLAFNVIDILQRKNLSHLGNQLELDLYGNPALDFIDNRQILLSAIKYVKDTK